MKKWYKINALSEDKGARNASVSIRGNIGEWGVSDQDLIDDIQALGDINDLQININSNGGDLAMALGVFNFLRNHPAKITTYIEGVAASAASVIAMAGDAVIMPSNSVMMIHNPWTVAMGNADEMESAAKMLRKFEDTLVTTYAARTKLDSDELKVLLADETWFTATEAFEKGFCDQVQDIGENYALAMAKATGIPESVLAKLEASLTDQVGSQKSDVDNQVENQAQKTDYSQEIQTLCLAAKQPDLVDSMTALSEIKGLDAVKAVLARTVQTQLQPTGINPVQSSQQQKENTSAAKLAKLSLTAINRKHNF
jgi:ATP-dependent protease ClpP protease subunit